MKQIISIIAVLLLISLVTISANSNIIIAETSPTDIPAETVLSTKETALSTTSAAIPPTKAPTEISYETIVKLDNQSKSLENTISYDNSNNYDSNSNSYSYDLDLLARLIYVEAGCYWIPKDIKLYVGSVVLNRVKSPLYPNTIEGVIYEDGQYCPENLYLSDPSPEVISIAQDLLENGSILPADVLGQNGDATGDEIYFEYYDEVLGNTIYFTYVY